MKDNYGLIFPGISVIITQHMDRYRSGHNGPDSKSGSPAMGSWVRIPPCPPITRFLLRAKTLFFYEFPQKVPSSTPCKAYGS